MNLSEDYFSKNYFSDEKFSDFFEESNYDSKVLYFRRVFRRHHSFNDPVNFIDINGLSPEDVKRIQSEFNSMVASMNRVGARRPGSGLRNGILNNIISTAQTFSSDGYLGCIDQANLTGDQLQEIKTDDKWKFSVVPNTTNTHHFIRATSSNPLDPVLIIDPWLNSFGTGK